MTALSWVDYFRMKAAVIDAGGWPEIRWQAKVAEAELTEQRFLRELAWVVLSSGMSAQVVDRVFPQVTEAFLQFSSASRIVRRRAWCRSKALEVFRHEGKIDAVLTASERIASEGLGPVAEALASCDPLPTLREFPYLGPATSRHLAKNLGFPVAKPDRHLLRIAEEYGYDTVDELCADISAMVGDPVPVVDVVMWRFKANGLTFATEEVGPGRALSCSGVENMSPDLQDGSSPSALSHA